MVCFLSPLAAFLSPLPARLRTFPEQKTTTLLAMIQNGMIPRGYATEPSPPLQSQIQSRYLFTSEISTEVIWRVLIGYNHSHCPFAALAFRKTNTHKVTLSFTVVGFFFLKIYCYSDNLFPRRTQLFPLPTVTPSSSRVLAVSLSNSAPPEVNITGANRHLQHFDINSKLPFHLDIFTSNSFVSCK